jgi:hypothetical protein
LRTLSDDIFVYKDENIAEKRYSDLVEALNASIRLIMPKLRIFITEKLNMRRRLAESVHQDINIYERLTISALKLLESLCEWVDNR